MRTIKELLEVLRDNSGYFDKCLCYTTYDLAKDGIISHEEER